MKGFLANLYLRPSCHQCAAKFGKSGSDITIADFWGIQQVMPDFDDDKGTGLVLVNTLKGEQYFTSLKKVLFNTVNGKPFLRHFIAAFLFQK